MLELFSGAADLSILFWLQIILPTWQGKKRISEWNIHYHMTLGICRHIRELELGNPGTSVKVTYCHNIRSVPLFIYVVS
jgi:hypothetical protein